jgi:hypothetical protein
MRTFPIITLDTFSQVEFFFETGGRRNFAYTNFVFFYRNFFLFHSRHADDDFPKELCIHKFCFFTEIFFCFILVVMRMTIFRILNKPKQIISSDINIM